MTAHMFTAVSLPAMQSRLCGQRYSPVASAFTGQLLLDQGMCCRKGQQDHGTCMSTASTIWRHGRLPELGETAAITNARLDSISADKLS